MKQWVKDFVLLGVGLWLLGYLASLLLFFSPFQSSMGWIITAVFTPFTIAVAWWWFRTREIPLSYYVKVGIAWTVIAVLLDYLFIVRLFQTPYYEMDVVRVLCPHLPDTGRSRDFHNPVFWGKQGGVKSGEEYFSDNVAFHLPIFKRQSTVDAWVHPSLRRRMRLISGRYHPCYPAFIPCAPLFQGRL